MGAGRQSMGAGCHGARCLVPCWGLSDHRWVPRAMVLGAWCRAGCRVQKCRVLGRVPRASPGALAPGHQALGTKHGTRHQAPGTRHPFELVLFDRPGLASAVVPAIRADTMRRLRLVAVRALAQPHGLQRVVRAALGGTCLRVSSFGIRHSVSFLRLLFSTQRTQRTQRKINRFDRFHP
jgi:hypothetical protein